MHILKIVPTVAGGECHEFIAKYDTGMQWGLSMKVAKVFPKSISLKLVPSLNFA